MKSTSKVSPIKYREILETIAKVACKNNEDEKNEVLNDIYRMAHAFGGDCQSHNDWRELYEEIKRKLKDY